MKLLTFITALLLSITACCQQEQSFTVHFDFDKHALTPTATASLDSFITSIKANRGQINIRLSGHCDAIGNNDYNDVLSDKRVAAVKNYLLKNNFAEGSFAAAEGHGKRAPLNDNTTDNNRLLNRRVEIAFTVATPPAAEKTIIRQAETVTLIEQPKTLVPQKKLAEQIADTTILSGSNIVLKNINFVGAMHQFLPESFPVLKELLDVMRTNKKLIIQVQGHICCLPGNVDGFDTETRTNNLSEERAKAVWQYLLKNGVEPARVSYNGLGHSKPLYGYPEKNEEEKTLNRRVEIKIISK